MGAPAVSAGSASPTRLRALVVPREHGAWGLLFIPLLTGAAVGLLRSGALLPTILLALLSFFLFWLRTPVESLLATGPMRAQSAEERRYVLHSTLVIGLCGLCLLGGLLWYARSRALLLLGGASALAFVLQAVLRKLGRRTRMLSQIVGALGLTATAPAAYCVATGSFDSSALGLWLANWLFAGDQVHFVQLRIHAARVAGLAARLKHGAAFLAGHFFLIFVLAGALWLHLLPRLAWIAFVLIVLRGIGWFFERPVPLAVRRLGWMEVLHGLLFGILLTAAFALPR